MRFEDEKDYIMRMIKEMVSVLFSILLGKQYVSVDEERKNGYEVSGTDLNDLLDMIDNGQINEAENLMLDDIDYSDKKGLAAALLFYQYLSKRRKIFCGIMIIRTKKSWMVRNRYCKKRDMGIS